VPDFEEATMPASNPGKPEPRPGEVPVVPIARCSEHGLHGHRQECFVCGGEVEQVEFIDRAAFVVELATLRGYGLVENTTYYRILELITPMETDDA